MDLFDRIYGLDRILRRSRYPVTLQALQEKLECSRAAVNRIILDMRIVLGASICLSGLNGFNRFKRFNRFSGLIGLSGLNSFFTGLIGSNGLQKEVLSSEID